MTHHNLDFDVSGFFIFQSYDDKMMMHESLIKTKAINFKSASMVHNTYQFWKQYPQEGIGNFTQSSNSALQCTFQISLAVINPSKCFLNYTRYTPAQGAGNYIWYQTNRLKDIQCITVQIAGGPFMMNIQYFDHYLDTISRRNISFDDLETLDISTDYTAAALTGNGTLYERLVLNAGANAYVRLDNSAVI